jgi:hypothetical protein
VSRRNPAHDVVVARSLMKLENSRGEANGGAEKRFGNQKKKRSFLPEMVVAL